MVQGAQVLSPQAEGAGSLLRPCAACWSWTRPAAHGRLGGSRWGSRWPWPPHRSWSWWRSRSPYICWWWSRGWPWRWWRRRRAQRVATAHSRPLRGIGCRRRCTSRLRWAPWGWPLPGWSCCQWWWGRIWGGERESYHGCHSEVPHSIQYSTTVSYGHVAVRNGEAL